MQDLNVPLPSVFVANLLARGGSMDFEDNSDVGGYVVANALADLGGRPITSPSPEGNRIIAEMMAAEAVWNVTRTDQPTSLNWYTKSIEDMVSVAALLHPEIKDDGAAARHPSGAFRNAKEAKTVLFAAIAITSQNNKVIDNIRYAFEQYRHFLEHGRFESRGYGAKGAAIKHNLERFNILYERSGHDLGRVHRLLNMKVRMKDLQTVAARHGIRVTGSELADEQVYGSIIFGPKVGNGFFQNLMSNSKPVTIDLWFMRTWGRYTGTLVRGDVVDGIVEKLQKGLRKSLRSEKMRDLMRDAGVLVDPARIPEMDTRELFSYTRNLRIFWEGIRRAYVGGRVKEDMSEKHRKVIRSNEDASDLKQKLVWPLAAESISQSLGYPIDSPKNASHRRWIREVVADALSILAGRGYNLTAADLQAILWYPEKEVYASLTNRSAEQMNMSYDQAVIRMAQNEGYSDDDIAEALRTHGDGRRNGRTLPGVNERGVPAEPVRLFG